jgi:hypothetical protein
MKTKLLCALLLLISIVSGANAQLKEGETRFWTFISVAYWGAGSDLNDYYNEVLGYYRDNGIPIPTQTAFGTTLCINGGILVCRTGTIKLGISLGYRYSPAYSSYEDYAGTLKVNGSIHTYEIGLVIKATMAEWWGFPVILSFEPGLGHMYATITQDLKYFGTPQLNFDAKWTNSAWGYHCRMMVGTSLPVGQFDLGLNAGYQASWTESTNAQEFNLPMILNEAGPVLLVSLGFTM